MSAIPSFSISFHRSRSRIHRIGVFAEESLSEGAFLIEYVGEIIRNGLVESREYRYRQKVSHYRQHHFCSPNFFRKLSFIV